MRSSTERVFLTPLKEVFHIEYLAVDACGIDCFIPDRKNALTLRRSNTRWPLEQNVSMIDDGFTLLEGGAELLDRVEPLWVLNRRHHATCDPQWSASFVRKSFAERRAELTANGKFGLRVILAQVETSDIGYCVCTIETKGIGTISSLFAKEDWRGKGVGGSLMKCGLGWLRQAKVSTIAVDVLHANTSAQRFYERYGFRTRSVRLLRDISNIDDSPPHDGGDIIAL